MRSLSVLSLVIFLLTAWSAFDTETAPEATPAQSETPAEKIQTQVLENARYTYVLIHGASGGGWDWKTVDELLTADGHGVYRPTLTGLGEKVHLSNPNIDLTTHINDIVNVILFEERAADSSWQRAKARDWKILTLESDHNAQRSHPEELVAMLEAAPG